MSSLDAALPTVLSLALVVSLTSAGGASKHRAPGLHTPAQQKSSVNTLSAQCSTFFFGSRAIVRSVHTYGRLAPPLLPHVTGARQHCLSSQTLLMQRTPSLLSSNTYPEVLQTCLPSWGGVGAERREGTDHARGGRLVRRRRWREGVGRGRTGLGVSARSELR